MACCMAWQEFLPTPTRRQRYHCIALTAQKSRRGHLLATTGTAAALPLRGARDPLRLEGGNIGVGVIALLLVAPAVDHAHYVVNGHCLQQRTKKSQRMPLGTLKLSHLERHPQNSTAPAAWTYCFRSCSSSPCGARCRPHTLCHQWSQPGHSISAILCRTLRKGMPFAKERLSMDAASRGLASEKLPQKAVHGPSHCKHDLCKLAGLDACY